MADQEISLGTMRFLFRLLDEDGGGSLSAGEIKRGMLLLGYQEAHDPLALGRLLRCIDEDRTGAVSESEFLSFMRDETRRSLHAKMARWSIQVDPAEMMMAPEEPDERTPRF
jgi:Ca2+-binding EF-hand superfamily protein